MHIDIQTSPPIHRALFIERFQSTSDIPLINRIVAMTSRKDTGSLRTSTPPAAAIAGTDNWTLAACVALNKGKAAYHTA
jgi:hypothetical protein